MGRKETSAYIRHHSNTAGLDGKRKQHDAVEVTPVRRELHDLDRQRGTG
jgi:hypothetical protein